MLRVAVQSLQYSTIKDRTLRSIPLSEATNSNMSSCDLCGKRGSYTQEVQQTKIIAHMMKPTVSINHAKTPCVNRFQWKTTEAESVRIGLGTLKRKNPWEDPEHLFLLVQQLLELYWDHKVMRECIVWKCGFNDFRKKWKILNRQKIRHWING